jgi:riboflavin kinase/FMN adenylyltransferase
MLDLASELDAVSGVWTFSKSLPKPEFERLMSDEQLLEGLGELGVREMHRMNFEDVCRLSARDFIERILLPCGVKGVVLGEDSRLGFGRETGAMEFSELAAEKGIVVRVLPLIGEGNALWSSTLMREMVRSRDWKGLESCCGRPYSLWGRVVKDQELARTLGFPTANIELAGRAHPPKGVYAVRVRLLDEPQGSRKALAYIGSRPTVGGHSRNVLEVHLLDFTGDLYGDCLEVSSFQWIRPERKFSDIRALQSQIQSDLDEVLSWSC